MHKALPLLFSLALTLPAAAHATTCPPDTIQLWEGGAPRQFTAFVSTDFSMRVDRTMSFTSPPTSATAMGRYDLRLGQVAASAHGEASVNSVLLPAEARVSASDTYQLVGPVTGAPITFVARLRLHVICDGDRFEDRGGMFPDWFPGGSALCTLSEPASLRQVSYEHLGNIDIVHDLDLSLSYEIAQPFTLRMHVFAEGTPAPDNAADTAYPNSADLVGDLMFPDLPQGYSVVSCQGYAPEAPVPSRTTTWGRIKSLNR